MSFSFFSLPCELRDLVYEHHLVHDVSIYPRTSERKLTPGLLRANKAIHHEATPIFYGRNRFDFSTGTSIDMRSFLRHIGRTNSGHIRQISIGFPACYSRTQQQIEEVALEDDSARVLANIRRYCNNVKTLQVCLLGKNYDAFMTYRKGKAPDFITQVLEFVDTHFTALQSGPKIIVEPLEGDLEHYLRWEIERLKWIVVTSSDAEGYPQDPKSWYREWYYNAYDKDEDEEYERIVKDVKDVGTKRW